jgi:hypothetical protein
MPEVTASMIFHLFALAAFAAAPTDAGAPYIETFHRPGKTLVYVAASHHSAIEYPDATQDPVFKTISYVFHEAPPDAVMVEGVDPSELLGFRDYAGQCAASKYTGTYCGEATYATHLATQNGVEVYTGEPSAHELLSLFQSRGYAIVDYFGFIAMRQIPFAKTRPKVNIREVLDSIARQQNRLLGTSVSFTEDDFARWYANHMQIPPNYMDLMTKDGSPYIAAGVPKTLFHTLSALSDEARDSNIVETVKTALYTHSRVLIVYGASHLTFEWNDLVRMMGEPRKTKVY